MKQTRLFLTAAIAIIMLYACSDYDRTDLFIGNQDIPDNYVPDIAWQDEIDTIYNYLKFENDSFYYDITREEALKKGLSDKVFSWAQNNAKQKNKRVQDKLKNGIKLYFVKYTTDNDAMCNNDQTNLIHNQRSIQSRASYRRGDLYGDILFPDRRSEDIYIDYSLFNCFQLSDFEHIMGKSNVGIPYPYNGYVEYEITVIGRMKSGAKTGNIYSFKKKNDDPNCEYIKFTGDSLDNNLPQTVEVIAEIVEEPDKPQLIFVAYAYVHWQLSAYKIW